MPRDFAYGNSANTCRRHDVTEVNFALAVGLLDQALPGRVEGAQFHSRDLGFAAASLCPAPFVGCTSKGATHCRDVGPFLSTTGAVALQRLLHFPRSPTCVAELEALVKLLLAQMRGHGTRLLSSPSRTQAKLRTLHGYAKYRCSG